jgi:hypothetical protein
LTHFFRKKVTLFSKKVLGMSTVPSTPQIKLNPVASNTALNFYWLAPTTDGGSPVSSYTLLCSSIPYSTSINSLSTYCRVAGLTNAQNYTFQLAANNAVGISAYTPFLIAQPGIFPGGPTSIGVSTVNSTTANVVWSFSTNTNEGENKHFIVTVVPSTITSTLSSYFIPVYQDQRSQLVSNLTSPYVYTIIVQSVTDNEWSYPSVSSIAYMGVTPPP